MSDPRIVDARSRPPIAAFLPDRTYVNLERTLRNVRARGWTPAPAMEGKDLDGYLAECAAAGIVRAGIPARAPNRWWGGQGNAPVFAACAERPGFFFGYAAVDPFAEGAADSVAGLRDSGARAIVLEPGVADEPAYVDDPRIDPVYEASLAAGLPVLLMGGGETGPDLSFSDPLRFERVAIRFPGLPLVNVHGGWPHAQAALGVAFRRPNVWMLPDVYFPGLPGEHDYVLAMRTYLADRFLFATGYPFCPVQATVDRYLSFGLPDETLENVLYHNAVRLFGLDL
ncbi:amidohydrolase family protein [Rhizohabitans arisaemae]|uniref:amidohydrolase family protein n=1 Tax=Rhizohabitans arisaemae TaxID=2720610 RepID=UPI0024B1F9EF|nr:amidohydrolase family protein [Rhizohabitans arisaemae]